MAVYKVPQNVEAEDKLLGPLTFKQFIYLIVAVMSGFVAYGLYQVSPVLAVIPLPITAIFAILGIYQREDQPIETFALAFLNFLFKPRKRLWVAGSVTETVHITAPKKPRGSTRKIRTKEETKGQLKRLANIVDTRGWYSKRPELQEPSSTQTISMDDRLVVPTQNYGPDPIDVHASDDMLDTYNNPVAQNLGNMAQSTEDQAKQTAINKMKDAMKAPAETENKRDRRTLPSNKKIQYNPYPDMQQKVVKPSEDKPVEANKQPATTNTQQAKEPQTTDHKTNKISDDKETQSVEEQAKNDARNNAILKDIHSDVKLSQLSDKLNKNKDDDGQIDEGEEVSLR